MGLSLALGTALRTPLGSGGPDRAAAGVRRIATDRSVAEAARLLAQPEVGALLVVEPGSGEDGAVVGLLTERDLFRAVAVEGPAVFDRCVWLIADNDFPAIDAAASAAERMRAFCERRVDHIALMDGGWVCGVLSIWDCAGAAGRLAGQAVHA